MMKTIRLAIAATALLSLGSAAVAQSATDARCVILGNVFAKQAKDDDARKLAEASMYFYLGRIGHASSAQVKAQFDQQSKTITDTSAGGMMADCVKGFQDELQLIQSLAGATAASPPAKPPGK
jgi:hypothetical protein